MKTLLSITSLIALVLSLVSSNSLHAADARKKPGPKDYVASSRTFYIEGVRSEADVKTITTAALKVNTVSNIVDFKAKSGFANISFDHHSVTHQQIAQAILDAGPFTVSFKFTVPDYSRDAETAKKMDAVFSRFSKLVSIQPIDKSKGLFVIRFLPFTPAPGQPLGNGFNFGNIAHPVIDPAPKGMGLRIVQSAEGSLAKSPPSAAKGKGKKKR